MANLCSSCQADQDQVYAGLMEGRESENYDIALAMMTNCRPCRQAMIDRILEDSEQIRTETIREKAQETGEAQLEALNG